MYAIDEDDTVEPLNEKIKVSMQIRTTPHCRLNLEDYVTVFAIFLFLPLRTKSPTRSLRSRKSSISVFSRPFSLSLNMVDLQRIGFIRNLRNLGPLPIAEVVWEQEEVQKQDKAEKINSNTFCFDCGYATHKQGSKCVGLLSFSLAEKQAQLWGRWKLEIERL